MTSIVLLGILALVPIIVIVAIILLATKKSEEPFHKKVDTIYNYIISLVALIMIIVGVVLLITSITDLLLPTQSTTTLRELNDTYVSIIGSIGVIIVGIPLFLVHQKHIQKK